MNLEAILQGLIEANVRYELLIRALIDVMETKKNADGTPLITKEEISARAEELRQGLIERTRIAKPSLIIPPDATV